MQISHEAHSQRASFSCERAFNSPLTQERQTYPFAVAKISDHDDCRDYQDDYDDKYDDFGDVEMESRQSVKSHSLEDYGYCDVGYDGRSSEEMGDSTPVPNLLDSRTQDTAQLNQNPTQEDWDEENINDMHTS